MCLYILYVIRVGKNVFFFKPRWVVFFRFFSKKHWKNPQMVFFFRVFCVFSVYISFFQGFSCYIHTMLYLSKQENLWKNIDSYFNLRQLSSKAEDDISEEKW